MATLVSDIINEAFLNLQAIQSGLTPTAAELADAFLRLNQMYAGWAAEQLTTNAWYHQALTVTAGTSTYTFGTAGTLVATATPIRITGAASYATGQRSEMRVISHDEFAASVHDPYLTSSVLAKILAADTAYPAINLRIWPTPASSPGQLLLDYYGTLTAFAATSTSLSLPPGWEDALQLNLAVALYPQYIRQGGIDASLAASAQNAKQRLVAINQAMLSSGKPQQGGQ